MIKNVEQPYNWYNLEPNYRTYLTFVKRIRPVSIKNYISDVKYFFGWISTTRTADISPAAVLTPASLEEFKSFLLANHLPTRTINRRLSSLRSFCEFLISQNIIHTDPSRHIRNYSNKAPAEADVLGKFLVSLRAQGVSNDDLAQVHTDVQEFIQLTRINIL